MSATRIPSRSKRYQAAVILKDQLALKYHKDLSVRPEKNNRTFMILEEHLLPAFKLNSKTKYANYRVGFEVNPGTKFTYVSLKTSYNESPITNLVSNFDMGTFKKIIKALDKVAVGREKFILWSSKQALSDATTEKKQIGFDDKVIWFRFESVKGFSEALSDYDVADFQKDLGCKPPPTGKGKEPPNSGFHFEFGVTVHPENAFKAADLLFPMYRWLTKFPNAGRRIRRSDLRRALLASYKRNNKEFECGFKTCNVKGAANLEAAHIIADERFGTDSPTNGVLLCPAHHDLQEGKPLKWQKTSLKVSAKKGTILE